MTVTGQPMRSAPAPLAAVPGPPGHHRRRVIGGVVVGVAVAGLLFVVALWISGGALDGFSGSGGWETEVGRLTGLIASYLLLIQVLLMARIPWLEGIWGQDVLARQHRLVGFASFDLMLVHIVLIVLGYAAAADNGVLAELWQLLTVYPGILLAAAGTAALVAVVVTSIRAARRSLRYESWHLIHLYAYLGVGLALPHQLWTGADFVGSPIASAFWWTIWASTAAALVLWRMVTPVMRSIRHDIRVSAVVRESPDVLSIVMAGRDLDRLGLRAGQFCQWRFLGAPGWTRAHPFTVSAVPTATRLRITVRTTGDGTQQLTTLRPGSRVLIEGPYGVMDPARRRHRDVLLIAAGVGVTTMRGIAEAVLAEPAAMGHRDHRRPSVVVLHRIRSGVDALFLREFGQLAATGRLTGLSLVGHRSEVSGWWGGEQPVDPAAALIHVVPDLRDREVYLCGPGPWMVQVKQTLDALDVQPSSVHAEEFAW